MSVTATPIFAQSPIIGHASVPTPTAITSGASISGTTGLTQVTATTTNGMRVDWIRVVGQTTTAAAVIYIWLYDGTTSILIDEILVAAATPSTTVASNIVNVTYYGGLNLPPTYQLFCSSTIAQAFNIFAFGGAY